MKKILVLVLFALSCLSAQVVKPIQVTGILNYSNGPLSANLNVGGLYVSAISPYFLQGSMLVPTTITALPVTGLNTPGWYMIVNNDSTNYVTLYTSVSGTAFNYLLPGEFAMGRFAPGVSAPAVKANVASLQISYLLMSN